MGAVSSSEHCTGGHGEDNLPHPPVLDQMTNSPAVLDPCHTHQQMLGSLLPGQPWQQARDCPTEPRSCGSEPELLYWNLRCVYSSEARQTAEPLSRPSRIRQAELAFLLLKYLQLHPHSRD